MANDVNTEIADAITLQRLRLLRYEGGVARDMVAIYTDAIGDLEREIARLAAQVAKGGRGVVSMTRLRGLVYGLKAALDAARGRLAASIEEGTTTAAQAEDDRLKSLMVRSVGRSWVEVPDLVVARAAQGPDKAPWTKRLAPDLVELNAEIGAATARGIARGASMPDIARMLKVVPGLVETYRDRLVVIARTEVQRAANEVAMANYAANNDVISGVQWLATLDSRTCLRCAPRHNQVYPLVNGRPVGLGNPPPLHPRCRCFMAPVTRSYADLGLPPTHANRTRFDGEPAREQTFSAWLRRQPIAVQREVLGPARLALFRGGMPLDDFVVGSRILTVAQVRALAAS